MSSSTQRIIQLTGLAIATVLMFAAVFFLTKGGIPTTTSPPNHATNAVTSQTPSLHEHNLVAVEPIVVPPEHIARDATAGQQTYTSPTYGFSITYPDTLTVVSYDEGGESETIVFQAPGSTEAAQGGAAGSASASTPGFQIFISPFDSTELTEATIRRLQPFTAIENAQQITLSGVPAVLFFSTVPELGRTREVWFAHHGHLFAITARARDDAWLSALMSSWQFLK